MSNNWPLIICTSVIRSSIQGESHGGMYLVDLNKGSFKQVVDWNDQSIDWQGRGADRGLRGLAFYKDLIIAAASDEFFFYDQTFRIVKSFRSPYLKHCHEIFIENDKLYLSSTGFDSILIFNLITEKFERGYCYRRHSRKRTKQTQIQKILSKLLPEKIDFSGYEPNEIKGPEALDSTHINNVFVVKGNIYFSGTGMDSLMKIDQHGKVYSVGDVPKGTHNVQFYHENLLMNNTVKDSVIMMSPKGRIITEFEIKRYPADALIHTNLPSDHARQAFGRGLCSFENYIVAGSSPATISIYQDSNPKPLRSVNLTMDIRNAIHGLEVYPFESGKKLFV
jgi:hypothetical protein